MRLRNSADVQRHVIAVDDSLDETHPFGDQIVEFFDEDPDIVSTCFNMFQQPIH